MPPKPRSNRNSDLPANLYESAGYYTWRDPRTGQRFTIGRDRALAIEQAKETNTHLARAAASLVERVDAPPARTIATFCPAFRERIDEKTLANNTRYNRKWQINLIERELGDVAIGPRQEDATEITRRCSEWLRAFWKRGKQRSAKALRSRLIEMFAEMGAAGWIAVNPIYVIKLEGVVVRRMRITLDDFRRIYKAAEQLHPWVSRSLELGLVTLQRREDVAVMGFRDVEDGRLKVEQGKTSMRIRIPLELRLQAVNWSLGEIIKRCRDNVVSRALVHHSRTMGQATAGDPVHPQTITGAFREAREIAGIIVPEGKTPPTYHELRSLGLRLYKQQGYDPQALAGHKDPDTTAVYLDNRGAEWINVAS